MTKEEAIEWIKSLEKTMLNETRVGPFPDPEYRYEVYEALDMAIEALKLLSADAERTEKWLKVEYNFENRVKCSNCGILKKSRTKYCPDCGAKMSN